LADIGQDDSLGLAPSGSARIGVMEDNEHLDAAEPDIQELISRWAGESKRLLIALPGVLAKLEDLEAETDGLRQRLADLERENHGLRQSREELAETFAKLKALIAGTTVGDAVTDLEAQRPRPSPPHAPSAEPTERESVTDGQHSSPPPAHHERPASAPPVSPEPNPRFAGREEKPPAAKPEEPAPPPSSVRFSSVFRPPTRP